MTSHQMHTGVFSKNIYNVDRPGEYWRRAVRRSVKAMSEEIKSVRFSLGFQVMDVEGVNSDTIRHPRVAEELQRLLALALAMGKEEFVVRDICPSCPTGQTGSGYLNEASELISNELQLAFLGSGVVPALARLSLCNGRFDLRVTLPTLFKKDRSADPQSGERRAPVDAEMSPGR